ncbi:MAG: SGNH/GDSL hydrolase family protein [Saccharofermentans sp.]|nr:SGNH/GDSL hydrolase family protein [Saccharofermentans sp.]
MKKISDNDNAPRMRVPELSIQSQSVESSDEKIPVNIEPVEEPIVKEKTVTELLSLVFKKLFTSRRFIAICCWILTIVFIALTVFGLYVAQRLVMPKYQHGIVEGSMIEEYYQSGVPHEVLFLGDCEVYENISTVTLYENYGISSYIRGSAQQLTWQSYYLLEDTLRYETPDVVIFNVLALKYGEPQSESYNRMTLDGMEWSSTKWDAINASMTEGENMLDYIFPILRYHSRWSELTQTDFDCLWEKNRVTVNGYYMRADVNPEGEFPPAMPLTDYRLPEASMDYLARIAQLCRENDIELVLIKAPTLYPYWYEEWDSQVRRFANTNNIPYINYIYLRDQIGLDMTVDTYDAGLHLNVTGAEKWADYIGAYLVRNFELTDYREVPEVATIWDHDVEFYNNLRDAQLAEIEQYGELMSWGVNAIE